MKHVTIPALANSHQKTPNASRADTATIRQRRRSNITRKIKRPCSHPGCVAIGVVRIENNNWLCLPHTQDRIDLLHSRELTQADEDLESFREQGSESSMTNKRICK